MADKELSGFILCWKVGSKPGTRRNTHSIHSGSWKQAWRAGSCLYLKDKMLGEVLYGETTFRVSQVHELDLQPCAPTTQVVKSSTKHHENQNKSMKKIKTAPKVSEGRSETSREWFDLSFCAAQLPICEQHTHSLCEDKLLPVKPPGFTSRGEK